MDHHIYCFSIIGYYNIPKILAFYCPHNLIEIQYIKNIFSNPNFNIKPGVLSSFSNDSKIFYLYLFVDINSNLNPIIFLVVTKLNYPQRLVYDCVQELENYSRAKVNFEQIKINNYDLSLNKNFLQIFSKLYDKYTEPESIDALIKVSNKINKVKNIMHENIQFALENTTKMESIELKSEELLHFSADFKSNTTKLKNKMWWKNFKIKLIVFSIIAIILTIIISTSVIVSKQK